MERQNGWVQVTSSGERVHIESDGPTFGGAMEVAAAAASSHTSAATKSLVSKEAIFGAV